LFDLLVLDALYAQTPLLELAKEKGGQVVISLPQNCRDLYPSAVGLLARRPPDATFSETQDPQTYRVQLWDTEDLPFTIDNPAPVRVVRSEEVLERNRFREGRRVRHATDQEWPGITTLPQSAFAAAVIRQLGHSRWKQENNGWMDLSKHGAFQHGFLHACQHRPQRLTAAGQREPVANHGWAAVTWILLIAAALSSCFLLRHSKLVRRDHLTAMAVAAQLRAWTSKTPPSIRAPD